MSSLKQRFFDVYLPGLPISAHGTRVVHLTDIHRCKHTADSVISRSVEIANSLSPDVIVLTGDFVTEDPADIPFCASLLSPLQAKWGVFAVLGNHDYTADASEVVRQLELTGIEFLINRNITLPNGLKIVGLDDDREGKINLSEAHEGVDSEEPSLTLIHNPAVVEKISERPSLVLAGHTHGGQVDIPPFSDWEIKRIGGKGYKAGWFNVGRSQMFVNRGIGQVAFPFRFRAAPEVAIFTLFSK